MPQQADGPASLTALREWWRNHQLSNRTSTGKSLSAHRERLRRLKIPYSHQEIQAPHCEKGSSGWRCRPQTPAQSSENHHISASTNPARPYSTFLGKSRLF